MGIKLLKKAIKNTDEFVWYITYIDIDAKEQLLTLYASSVRKAAKKAEQDSIKAAKKAAKAESAKPAETAKTETAKPAEPSKPEAAKPTADTAKPAADTAKAAPAANK